MTIVFPKKGRTAPRPAGCEFDGDLLGGDFHGVPMIPCWDCWVIDMYGKSMAILELFHLHVFHRCRHRFRPVPRDMDTKGSKRGLFSWFYCLRTFLRYDQLTSANEIKKWTTCCTNKPGFKRTMCLVRRYKGSL